MMLIAHPCAVRLVWVYDASMPVRGALWADTEIFMQTNPNNDMMRQLNAFAMHHGVVLGLWGMLTLTVFKWSMYYDFFSTLFAVMLLGSPVMSVVLTLSFRRSVSSGCEPFGFARGFLHALFTGFYASVWVALFVFVYLHYFDHGTLFDAYSQRLQAPDMRQQLRASGMEAQINLMTGGKGVEGLAEQMRQIGASTYAALALYAAPIVGPVVSVVAGLAAWRRGNE